MTLVLPAPCRGGLTGGKQQLLPFDGEPLDFETALNDFADWPKWSRGPSEELCSMKRKPEVVESNPSPAAKRHRAEEESDDFNSTMGAGLVNPPRRRVSMMWSPRLRQKDERRRVFKISLNKLRRIEDPETFLRRSVLVNNTVKRLQQEIREEKFAKYPSSWGHTMSSPLLQDSTPSRVATPGPQEEDTDELFGVQEDFLRIPKDNTRGDSGSSPYRTNEYRYPSTPCSSQFRENEGTQFNPPILDSAVYHSLLASLES